MDVLAKSTTKALLWANLSTLMARHWGGENLSRLAREAAIGPGGATRLKDPDPEASVRVAMLERLAAIFGVEPWQLIAPNLGEHLYVLDEQRRLEPVYRPSIGNVVSWPDVERRAVAERRADGGGGLRKSAEQKARFATRRAAKKNTG